MWFSHGVVARGVDKYKKAQGAEERDTAEVLILRAKRSDSNEVR